MAVIHVTEAEAARDLPALLARVREGADVQIESGPALIKLTVATTENPPRPRFTQPRLLSDILADLKEQGSNVTLDDQFGADLEAVIALRDLSGWPEWD